MHFAQTLNFVDEPQRAEAFDADFAQDRFQPARGGGYRLRVPS
jgi:hypothetical protein